MTAVIHHLISILVILLAFDKMLLTMIVLLCLGVVYSSSYCVRNAEYCYEIGRMVSLYVDEFPG